MIKEAIAKVVERVALSEAEMIEVMGEIMGGEATQAQVAAFITALRMKGETVDEIIGAAKVMRDRATPIRAGGVLDLDRDDINLNRETILDTCGTGGSGTKSFNISTTVAFVVAACGIKVAKHGNRSVSSTCGSADVLEALGVNLAVTPEKVEECIREAGIGFLFAPALHGAMKHAIGPRREIGIRTIFNILSPWNAGFTYRKHGSIPRMIKAAGGTIWSSNWRELNAGNVAEAKSLGLKVLAWTVNDRETMRSMLDLGVDGLVTDRPDIAAELLRELKIDW